MATDDKIRILSSSGEPFESREEAGWLLGPNQSQFRQM